MRQVYGAITIGSSTAVSGMPPLKRQHSGKQDQEADAGVEQRRAKATTGRISSGNTTFLT